MTQQYNFTTHTWEPIKLSNCRAPIMPANDNLTIEEKQAASAYWNEWLNAVLEDIRARHSTVYSDIVYLEDYLR